MELAGIHWKRYGEPVDELLEELGRRIDGLRAQIPQACLAAHLGFPTGVGQSQFAIVRGKAFEVQVKANGRAELLRLLRENLDLPIPEASYDDLDEVAGNTSHDVRHARTRALLAHAAAPGSDAGTLLDHPLLRLTVGGRNVYLEPDLIASTRIRRASRCT